MNYKKDLIYLGKMLHDRNYTPGYSGNLSVRMGENILITTSGSANGFLSEEDFVEIDFSGAVLNSDKKASSEKMLHIELYKNRADVNCVVHVHSTALSAYAAAGIDLLDAVMIENVCYFGGIPLAKYGMPSSTELVEETAKYFKDYSVVLMQNHGVIVGGSSIKDAYCKLEMAEEYAKTVIYANILGGTKPLAEKEVNKLLTMIKS